MNTPDAKQISRLLFDADPMNTCCRENDCFDEYDAIAADISHGLASGEQLGHAVKRALTDAFGVELTRRDEIRRTLHALEPLC
ncbi:hypothetical protein HNR62_003153 [Oceanisphaera litoralis]|uniref:hypothetical protein n=1 Tax=Oceanisphaera litoralis TaxID=225144 RepID=UPI001959E27F|nr:hypothetical protein [Oceanisphaera litoralis]MBM7457241.1 hypothetical protein [Oceanisphaera litoralis]